MEVISQNSLIVGHDRPSQRQYHRLLIPLNVKINGQSLRMENWSVSGFCIKELPASITPGDILTAQIEVPFQGFQVKFSTRVGVVRKNSLERPKLSSQSGILHIEATQNEAGLEFLNLNERQQSLLQHFSEQLLTGQMAKIDDTICRLDIPVTPPSTDFQNPNKSDTATTTIPEKKSWLAGMGYLASGLILTLLIGATVYHKLFLLEIESAVISSNVESLHTPTEGTITAIFTKEGDFLQPGAKIMQLSNLDFEEQKELAAIRIKESELKVTKIEALKKTEQQELDIYRTFTKNKLSVAKRHVYSLIQKMALLKRDWESKRNLAEKGMLSRTEQDQAQLRLISAEKELKESRSALAAAKELNRATNKGIYFSDGKRELNLDTRQAQIEHAREQVKLEQRKLALLKRREESMTVRSIHGGFVMQLNKEIGDKVANNEQLASINRGNNELTIDAYLSQVELTHIHLSSTAEIYIPALDQHYEATVTTIDGSQNLASKLQTGMNWANAQEKSGQVKLTLLNVENIDHKRLLTAGLPAVVRFQKYSFGLGDFNTPPSTNAAKQPALLALEKNLEPA